MTRPTNGRAGREGKRNEIRDSYGEELAQLMSRQLPLHPTTNLLHLGSVGALPLLRLALPRLPNGSATALVYTFDEVARTQAALSAFPQVTVINEWEELPPDTRYEVVTSIVPYHLSMTFIDQIIATGLASLKPGGVFIMGGDKRKDFERYQAMLAHRVDNVQTLATNSHQRVVQAEASAVRKRGGLRRVI